MVILGIADGPDAGAALIIDGQLVAFEPQERHDRVPNSRTFPWAAIKEVLEEAGLRGSHVDVAAVAGRFTPPFFLRRHPGLRKVARDAFSPAKDAKVFVQAMLRQTGLWALEADRAADWIGAQLNAKGFYPQRVVLVDTHRALATAAYRCQSDDDVLAFTLHPMGDGVACAVHRGVTGQLDKVWAQKGFSALHVHLERCAAAMGFTPLLDDDLMWAVAGKGEPDAELLDLLDHQLHVDGPRLSRRSYPLPSLRSQAVYKALAAADRSVAAASVYENLRRAVCDLIRWHLRTEEIKDVVLAGTIFDNPRLVAAVAEIDEVDTVTALPLGGYHALSVGAAADVGGLAPTDLPLPGIGREYHEPQCERALTMAGIRATRAGDAADVLAAHLADGEGVVRFQGRAGLGRWGMGSRSVLVRADDAAALERVRTALGRPPEEEPGCAWVRMPGDGEVRAAKKLAGCLRVGSAAVEVDAVFSSHFGAVVTPDARVHLQQVDADADPGLHRVLTALHRRSGCSAVACFPLAERRDPLVAVPGEAIRVWRRSGLAAMLLGPYLVQRGDGN